MHFNSDLYGISTNNLLSGAKMLKICYGWILVVNLANKKSKLTWWNDERKHILTEMINNPQLIIDYVYSLIPLSVERGANENREKRQPFFCSRFSLFQSRMRGYSGLNWETCSKPAAYFFCCTLFPNATLGY